MTARWWDEPPRPGKQDGRRPPAPDFRRRTTRPPFPRWSISVVAYGIKFATTAVILFVIGTVGLLAAPVLGLAGADVSEHSLMTGAIFVIVAVEIVGLTVQVGYIVRQGAERGVIACLAAEVATQIVGTLAGLAGLPSLALTVAGAVIAISVVALMIRPARPRTW